MINFDKKSNKKIAGFTLVETLVALFIFSISIMTVMSVLSGGITSTFYAKDKMTAEYLAQEGIEYFRNMRDTYSFFTDTPKDDWDAFIKKLSNAGCEEGCYFLNEEESFGTTTKDLDVFECDKIGCPNLFFNTRSGRYGYTTGTKSPFSRRMQIKLLDDGVYVLSKVTWESGAGAKEVSLSENLSSWIE